MEKNLRAKILFFSQLVVCELVKKNRNRIKKKKKKIRLFRLFQTSNPITEQTVNLIPFHNVEFLSHNKFVR